MCPCLLLEARRAATRVQASDQRGGLRGLPTSLALLSVGVCTEQRGLVQPDSLPRANSSVSTSSRGLRPALGPQAQVILF